MSNRIKNSIIPQPDPQRFADIFLQSADALKVVFLYRSAEEFEQIIREITHRAAQLLDGEPGKSDTNGG